MNKILGSEFKRGNGMNNMIAEYDGFSVSYAPYGSAPVSMFETDTSDGETALMIDGDSCYRILNGDWRLAYSELAPQGVEACKTFYMNKREQFGSSWSSD